MGGICDFRSAPSTKDNKEVDFSQPEEHNKNQNFQHTAKFSGGELDIRQENNHMTFSNHNTQREEDNENNNALNEIQEREIQHEDSSDFDVKAETRNTDLLSKKKTEPYSVSHGLSKKQNNIMNNLGKKLLGQQLIGTK